MQTVGGEPEGSTSATRKGSEPKEKDRRSAPRKDVNFRNVSVNSQCVYLSSFVLFALNKIHFVFVASANIICISSFIFNPFSSAFLNNA